MALPEIKARRRSWLLAGLDQDCPQHPRINQRRELQPEWGGGEKEGRERDMWHDRGVSSWARRRKIRDRWEKILFLARECPPPFTSEGLRAVNEQATGPSLPGSPLHRFVRSRLLSHCVRLSVCLSIAPFRLPHFSIPHSLFFTLKERKKKRTLLIDGKTDDDPVVVSSSRFT